MGKNNLKKERKKEAEEDEKKKKKEEEDLAEEIEAKKTAEKKVGRLHKHTQIPTHTYTHMSNVQCPLSSVQC